MEKKVAAIEFGTKKLKLVVGYELDGKVYVIYALTKPYGYGLNEKKFLDFDKVSESVKNIKSIIDPSANIKLSLSQATLALPPNGLEVFRGRQVSSIAGEGGLISPIDIKNVHGMVKNNISKTYGNSDIVDIIPKQYILSNGEVYSEAPLGLNSTSITLDAMVYSLPSDNVNDVENALRNGGMNVRRTFVAPFATATLISSDPEMPKDYFLVDIGSDYTTISLVGNGDVYASRFNRWGSDNITERIVENFNINSNEAEKIKILYGLDKRQMKFRASVCKSAGYNGEEIIHYSDELNSIIKNELEKLTLYVNSGIQDIISTYDKSLLTLPMILVGGGAQLNGLAEYIEPKVQSEKVIVYKPKALGARNATFTNCLGMILANAKYQLVVDEYHAQTGTLTRDPVKEK